jgi:hypothetical protein
MVKTTLKEGIKSFLHTMGDIVTFADRHFFKVKYKGCGHTETEDSCKCADTKGKDHVRESSGKCHRCRDK